MPRTGSKIYQYSLAKLKNVEVFDEVHYFRPNWVGKSFIYSLINFSRKKPNKLNKSKFFKVFYYQLASYWHSESFRNIGFNKILGNIFRKKVSFTEILNNIITNTVLQFPRKKVGFRAVLYPSYIEIIKRQYPSSRIIYTVRDPRAVFQSLFQNDLKKSLNKNFIFFRYYSLITRYFYTIISYVTSTWLKAKYENDPNVYFVRYEDVLLNNEKILIEICDFLDLSFNPDMMKIPRQDSSYSKKSIDSKNSGVDRKLKDAWKRRINPVISNSLTYILYRHMETFGYERGYI